MAAPASAPDAIRFGPFDLDPKSGELRKNGVRIKLQGQPFQVLCLLLVRPGEVVTREELRAKVWPADTFVDFDVGLNTAIKKTRDVLDDSAETPRFIETIPRRGYRFIYPIALASPMQVAAEGESRRARRAAVLVASLLVLASLLSISAVRDRLVHRQIPGKTLRVAVLPLKNLSGDPEQEYFAAGMTEMLITELGRLGPLQVTSHQSVLGYGQSNKPVPEIARELGVDAVLEGTVQRSDDKVRVTVNFVQAQPENHVLADSYEKNVRNVFEVQQEIARAIAGAIRIRLPSGQSAAMAREVAPQATDAFLHGSYLLSKGRESDRDEARVYFEKAIEIDPSFARPYATLAVMYAHGGAIRGAGGGASQKVTRQWANKALELDPTLAEPHAALGWIAMYDWDFKTAESEFQRAIEMNPSYPVARTWYAQFLAAMNRYPEAFAQTEVALHLVPGAPDIEAHALQPYLMGGKLDEAMGHLRGILEMHPDYWATHYFLSLGYMRQAKYKEALAEAEETVQADQRSPANLSLLGSALALAGEREKALAVIHELEKGQHRNGTAPPGEVARVYAALGKKEKALELLNTAYEQRRPGLALMNSWPQFESLRNDPRYQDLLHRIGLPPDPPSTAALTKEHAKR